MSRLRRNESLRAIRRETTVRRADLIFPIFVVENPKDAGPVSSMPGISRFHVDDLEREIEEVSSSGISGLLLFGIPAVKSASADSAFADDGIVPTAVQRIRKLDDRLVVMTDVCLCQYTEHGHCGLISDSGVDNDRTLETLAKTALSHARAGAHVVAPSGMMDGAVGAIRAALDQHGFSDVAILSYAVKYASSFYGPFREAADSSPRFGDRRGYQMDPANSREALAEARLDVEEGADVLMVKPALPYLDVIRAVREAHSDYPLAAYQVSGEYAMLKAAAAYGWLEERQTVLEALTCIKRAGADILITYFAKGAAPWLPA